MAARDLLDEDTWHLLAMASAARCIVSTLTLPIVKDGRIAGAVNLYGASRQAFTGHHEALAEIFGAWAPGAVTNADLSFSTRRDAEEAPRTPAERVDRRSGRAHRRRVRGRPPDRRALPDPRGRPAGRHQRGAACRGRDPAARPSG